MHYLLIDHCSAGTCIHQNEFLHVVRSEPSAGILNSSVKSFEGVSQHQPSFSAQTLFQHIVNHVLGKQMALPHWKLQQHWAGQWLEMKIFPSVSKSEREESKHILCLRPVWSCGLTAQAFQTDFSKWKSFIIFLWREIQTLWKMFCSTMDCRKQEAEIWKSAIYCYVIQV